MGFDAKGNLCPLIKKEYSAVQVKLGEALRSQYELARPLSDQLDALLKELERRTSDGGAPKSGEC